MRNRLICLLIGVMTTACESGARSPSIPSPTASANEAPPGGETSSPEPDANAPDRAGLADESDQPMASPSAENTSDQTGAAGTATQPSTPATGPSRQGGSVTMEQDDSLSGARGGGQPDDGLEDAAGTTPGGAINSGGVPAMTAGTAAGVVGNSLPVITGGQTNHGGVSEANSGAAPGPTAGGTIADSPIAGSTIADSPMAGSTIADSPMAGSTIVDSPIAGSPIAGSPIAGSPIADSPIAGSPMAGSPIAGSPIAGSPIAGSPIAGSPIAGSTIVDSPIAGSPMAGNLMSGGRADSDTNGGGGAPPTPPVDCIGAGNQNQAPPLAILGDPTAVGATKPTWRRLDYQPLSCGFGQEYGLDSFDGEVTLVALFNAGCGYCRNQASKLERMRLELSLGGTPVEFVAINTLASEPARDGLAERCSFPLFQDTGGNDAMAEMGGAVYDFYVYRRDGTLHVYLSNSAHRTNLSTDEGYENVKAALTSALANTPYVAPHPRN
ncbi:MAG: hypothetical protein VX589_21095 [Myxococcota bacterium]|nr:hypothetical protein [Myxococcota bacterium]